MTVCKEDPDPEAVMPFIFRGRSIVAHWCMVHQAPMWDGQPCTSVKQDRTVS